MMTIQPESSTNPNGGGRRARALNQTRWVSEYAFTAHGVSIGIRSNSAEALNRILERLPPGSMPAAKPWNLATLYSVIDRDAAEPSEARGSRGCPLRHHRVYRQTERLTRTSDLDWALDLLESDLTLYAAEHAPDYIFVHAGAVGWQGQAIVIPGPSYSGKSTLVAALVRAGAHYYSDEFAVLDRSGRVHPYPRPLSLREGPERETVKRLPETLGATVGEEPLPLGLVVSTRYEATARWEPAAMTPGQAGMALLSNTVCARSRPGEALEAITRAVDGAEGLSGNRGEAEELAQHLLYGRERASRGP